MELIAIDFSPWSRKARWALDHHGLDYAYVEYLPMLGAPYLRAKSRKLLGLVSVPTLVQDRGRVLGDSFAIARFADARGERASGGSGEGAGEGASRAEPLLVEESRGWNEASERILSAGRALTAAAVLEDPQAQKEALPGIFPDALRPMLRPMARTGAKYLARKYGFTTTELSEHRRTMHRELMGLRRALESREYLLERFSYADVAMAVSLQFVRPVDGWIALGPATLGCWTQPELAEEFEDLLAWRDGVFERHAPWPRGG